MKKINYKYQIGDIINESLKIIDYDFYEKEKQKGYTVQSLVYPDAPTYSVREYSLNNGVGCAYKSGNRIYEGNSLYSVKHIRKYLVDTEQSKILSKSNKTTRVKVKCTECGLEKLSTSLSLSKSGMYCPLCSKGTSYPELFMIAYLEVKGIKYEFQKGFKDLPRRKYDFYLPDKNLVIETHGKQHYEANEMWDFSETSNSDFIKEQYCLTNNISYLVLPTTKSTFDFLVTLVNESILPSIVDTEHEEILNKMSYNSKYPVRKMIELYQKGYSTRQIGEQLNIQQATVMYTLKKHNVNTSLKRRVRCITTGEEFDSIAEAMKKHPSATSIPRACKANLKKNRAGKRGYATSGMLPDYKGLKWEYVDDIESRPKGLEN